MSGLDLDKEFDAAGKRGFKAVELPVRLKATVTSSVRRFQSPNVVGILIGQDSPYFVCPGNAICDPPDRANCEEP